MPRMIDKARARLAGTLGEYIWNCPLDQKLLSFVKITAADFLQAVSKAGNDADVLAWVQLKAQSRAARDQNSPAQLRKWSEQMRSNRPKTAQEKKWFAQRMAEIAPGRSDLVTFFDLLDADEKRK